MGILVDLVVVAILILNIIIGYKKGLVNAIFSICAFLIAIAATFILYKPVSNIIINNTEIEQKIKEVIINNNTNEENTQNKEDSEKTIIQQYIDNAIKDVAENAKQETTELVANTIASKGVQILTWIILFVGIRIVLMVLKFLIEGIAELPIIKQFNQVGGLAYGILKGLVIIYLLLTIMFLVISINGNGAIAEAINNSHITKFLYDNNIVVDYCFLGKNLL
jgi:uncharacterized membrane protein required for colicin V production